MADVSQSGRSRGQLILVAGLTIAVILVALVLLLNTVIYTENVATRGFDTGGDDAIEYRSTVVDSVEEIIAKENAELYEEESQLDSNLTNALTNFSSSLHQANIRKGVHVQQSFDPKFGLHVWQSENDNFNTNFELNNIDEVRRFQMEFDTSYFNDPKNDTFGITFENGESYTLNKSETGTITMRNGNGDSCDISDSVDFINQSIDDGDDCNGFDWIDITNTDLIAFSAPEGDGTAGGTFNITVAGGDSDSLEEDYGYIVYDATLDIRYETRDIRFATEVDIEGAEPR